MKIFKRIILVILIFAGTFYAIPAALLQIPALQKKISVPIAAALTDKFQSEVRIGQIRLGFLNHIVLKDVCLEDRSKETLLRAERLTADFNIFALFRKKWRIRSIRLYSCLFNLSKETHDSPLNIQYLIDIFANPDSTKNTAVDLQIKSIALRGGVFYYREKDAPAMPGKFNPKSFYLNGITSKIKIRKCTGDTLDLIVNKLSFKEKTGFTVKRMSFDLKAGKEKAAVNRLSLKLENTVLAIKDVVVNYGKPENDNRFKNMTFRLAMDRSDVYLKDLSPFVPIFSQFDDKIDVNGYFSGTSNILNIQNLCFRYYNHLMLKTNAGIKNLFNPNAGALAINAQIEESFLSPIAVEKIINNFGKKPFELPAPIRQMNSMIFQGNISGSTDSLFAVGTFDSDVGTLLANVDIIPNAAAFKGEVASPKLNIATLTGNKDFGETVFKIAFDLKQQANKKFAGAIDGNIEKFEYKGYTYNNFNFKGNFTPESFAGLLNLDSPEGKIAANGLFLLKGAASEFKFTAKATGLQLDKLNIAPKYKNASLSFEVGADLTGNTPDNLLGIVGLNNLHFETDKGNYDLNRLSLTSVLSGSEKILSIESDILRGEIRGMYSFGDFIPDMQKALSHHLPSLFEGNNELSSSGKNLFSFDLTVEDLTYFSHILELPLTFREQTRITGQCNSAYDKFNLDADIRYAKFGNTSLKDLKIALSNSAGEALLNLSGGIIQKNSPPLRFSALFNADDDRVKARLNWGNASEKYRGDLNLNAAFAKEKRKPLYAQINIQQSNLIFNDSVWTLYPTEIRVDSSIVKIKHLLAAHNDQFLKINGAISRDPEQQLFVELNKVSLDYIFQSLQIKALEFGGTASGFVNIQDLYKTRKLSTRLNVQNFAFNQTVVGNLNLTGTWDDENQGVLLNGIVYENDSIRMKVNGLIYPGKERLSVDFDATKLNAAFLRKYLNKIAKNINGSLTGHIRLFGDLNDPTIEGTVYAENCRFGIEFLNTYYTFSDTIRCYPDEIRAENIRLFDEYGRQASANGHVKHTLFEDFKFSADASFNNFLIFNANKTQNPQFYGTVFGNGTVSLSGTEDLLDIDVMMQNTENTKLTLNFAEEPGIAEYDFIRFAKPKKTKTALPASAPDNNANHDAGTEIRLNLLLEANPQATIEMMMDPVSGDKISAYGSGNMQIHYGTATPLKVSGTYTIERGKYNFSFQQVIYRNFDIRDGSSVSFRGNPYMADLNVKANYKLTANLGDLHQDLIVDQQRVNTTVDCILQLTGPMNHPAITFDLDLPNSTPELNRQVKSYIRTEDMMNRQIFYLLVLNSFYPSLEYERSTRNTRNSADMSLLTSTLSTQLSNILDAFTDKIQLVGTKFYQSNEEGANSTEMEFLLSSQLLNNRLIINGNFGYRDNIYADGENQSNNIHWIGDFDLEYKLTKKGGVRLKFFNHYNYRNYYNLAPEMTQGLGILFRQDFNRFSDLKGKKNKSFMTDSAKVKVDE
ncbi:MAG: translocation/assembly module TamB [Dysgonamonadaceae bacterium]|jgi:autotransporter translocation and assembly factor TamB|nr:translocation/assembly module TamB [Dysgonamonadaceae bacterium]